MGKTFEDRDLFMKELALLVNQDSGSNNPNGVNCVASQLESWFREAGWQTDRHHLDERCGDMLTACNRKCEHYDVMLLGHMDTVFPEGTTAKRSFSLEEDGVTAKGPGVADMKHGLLVMVYLARMLGTNGQKNIMCVMTPDEELGSPYSAEVTSTLARHANQVMILEAASPDGAHCVERKGCLKYDILFRGIAAHAGYLFEEPNASAVSELCSFVQRLESLRDRERGITSSVGLISGGTAINVVPEEARLKAELRMWTNEEQAELERRIQDLVVSPKVCGCSIEIVSCQKVPPLQPSIETKSSIERLRCLAADQGIDFVVRPRGGITDANLLQQTCPVILDAMGPAGGNDHCELEFMNTDTIGDCLTLLLAYLG